MEIVITFIDVDCTILNTKEGKFLKYIYGVSGAERVTDRIFSAGVTSYKIVANEMRLPSVTVDMNDGGKIKLYNPFSASIVVVKESELPIFRLERTRYYNGSTTSIYDMSTRIPSPYNDAST